jgi:hypothetical protein
MDMKKEECELNKEMFQSFKGDDRIDIKYEDRSVPPFSTIICEATVSSVTNVSCCTETYLVPVERSGFVRR